ncbi:MAG: delta-60 repeat domain-containing protein, partial [Chitinophagales bacterium]
MINRIYSTISIFLFLTVFSLMPIFSLAQAGFLDLSFGTGGIVTTDFGGSDDEGRSVVIQDDGKILVAGKKNSDFAIVRCNIDGSLDLSFGVGGIVTTDFGTDDEIGSSIKLQYDGKIVVAGYDHNGLYDFALARYNNDGSLD